LGGIGLSNRELPTKTIGFIVNPIAGMGGAVGLKGTDGKTILTKAISLGAKSVASEKAEIFLSKLTAVKESLRLLVGSAKMGENQAKKHGFYFKAVGKAKNQTSPQDTQDVALQISQAKADLLVFCGGDGTTRDIYKTVGMAVPVIGVPSGVKMHSAVFAVTPQAAAKIAFNFLWGSLPLREAEVMDVDEQAFREGYLSAHLYGYMLSPFEPHLVQTNKMASPTTVDEVRNQAATAVNIIEDMQLDVLYIIGPGTTTRTIMDLLDQKKTLLGVDIIQNKKIIAADVNENQLLKATKGKFAKIIVTPIGGQGFVFGRGNQQISAKAISQIGLDNIIVVATRSKLDHLQCLKVDTGDTELDNQFRDRGIKVLIDYKTFKKMAIE
jgi:predicted polyphosphate/ATP-dependent NAD kinase